MIHSSIFWHVRYLLVIAPMLCAVICRNHHIGRVYLSNIRYFVEQASCKTFKYFSNAHRQWKSFSDSYSILVHLSN